MFAGFFYALREEGVPVSLYEWITLMEALSAGLARDSLLAFYYLARCVLVKSEAYYDKYDSAFSRYFKDNQADSSQRALEMRHYERIFALEFPDYNPEKTDDKRVPSSVEVEQLTDLTKLGTVDVPVSPPSDANTQGSEDQKGAAGTDLASSSSGGAGKLRVGGEGGGLSALKVAGKRRYRDYKDDSIRNIRAFEIALRTLRQLSTKLEGPKDELDLEATIEETGRNAGMLALVWDRPRKNTIKLLVLMDTIGSIYSYIHVCKRLFNAAHRSTHFKEIKFFYFHNCIYGRIYKDQWLDIEKSIPTEEFFRIYNSDYRVLIVGDAKMAKSELTDVGGIIDWSAEYNSETGVTWLKRVARHFPYCVWLNPVPEYYWGTEPNYVTVPIVGEIFPMFELTPLGLTKAIKRLKVKNK